MSIDTWFYLDPYVQKLAASEWPIFKYLFDSPERNAYGIYEISLETAAFHTRYDETELMRVFDRFARDGKAFYVDGWMIIRNHFKHNPITPKQVWLWKGLITLWDNLPETLQNQITNPSSELYIPYLDPTHKLWLGKDYPSPTLATLSLSLTHTLSLSLSGDQAVDKSSKQQETVDNSRRALYRSKGMR